MLERVVDLETGTPIIDEQGGAKLDETFGNLSKDDLNSGSGRFGYVNSTHFPAEGPAAKHNFDPSPEEYQEFERLQMLLQKLEELPRESPEYSELIEELREWNPATNIKYLINQKRRK